MPTGAVLESEQYNLKVSPVISRLNEDESGASLYGRMLYQAFQVLPRCVVISDFISQSQVVLAKPLRRVRARQGELLLTCAQATIGMSMSARLATSTAAASPPWEKGTQLGGHVHLIPLPCESFPVLFSVAFLRSSNHSTHCQAAYDFAFSRIEP